MDEISPFAERKGVRGMHGVEGCPSFDCHHHPSYPGIPRSHRFACSRPLTQAKGADSSAKPTCPIYSTTSKTSSTPS